MFIFLSKFLPQFVYPFGLVSILLVLALILYRRLRLQRALLILILALLWIGGSRWVAYAITRSLEWQYLPGASLPPSQVIVLLGGGTDSPDYPRQTVQLNGAGDRVFYAAYLYKQGLAPHILVSGGNLDWSSAAISPAQQMATALETMGVPKEAIWMEDKSRNTYENALNCRKILDEKGIHQIILVTSAIHMPRSVGLFRHQGLEVTPAPADFMVTQNSWQQLIHGGLTYQLTNLVPQVENLASVTVALKEYLGILVYHLNGWL